jgi:hypothetical protein
MSPGLCADSLHTIERRTRKPSVPVDIAPTCISYPALSVVLSQQQIKHAVSMALSAPRCRRTLIDDSTAGFVGSCSAFLQDKAPPQSWESTRITTARNSLTTDDQHKPSDHNAGRQGDDRYAREAIR